MNGCPRQEELIDFLADSARPEIAEAITTHVQQCSSCQQRLDGLTADAARSWMPEPTEATLPHDPAKSGGPPPRVPGYDVLEELGRGGYGVVYRARQLALDRFVALKVLRYGSQATPDERRRFSAEMRAAARLTHEQVVRVYDVGEHESVCYAALELAPGGSLARRLDGTPLPAAVAAKLAATLARAVQAAHERGVVHRDLKPGNVLLTDDTLDRPKVTDFGLSKVADDGGTVTATGEVLGTPSYMAPEQGFGRARDVGPAADVYALGAILYELLTGRPPFKGETPYDTLLHVRDFEPVPARQLHPTLAKDLETICGKCLRKAPADRYATALALAEDLEAFLASRPIRARPVGRLGRAWRWGRRNKAVAALLALLAFTTVAGLGVLTSLWLVAEDRRRDADGQRRRAEGHFDTACDVVDQFFVEVSDDAGLQAPEFQPLRTRLLGRANAHYQNLVGQAADGSRLRRRQSEAYQRIYQIEKSAGRGGPAEAAARRALAIMEALSAESPESEDLRPRTAWCLMELSSLGTVPPEEASDLSRRAHDLMQSWVDRHPDDVSVRRLLAINCFNECFHAQEVERDTAAALRFSDAAIANARAVLAAPAGGAGDRMRLAYYLQYRGRIHESAKDYAAAFPFAEQALEECLEATRSDPGGAGAATELSRAYEEMGRHYYRRQDPENGRRCVESAAKILQEALDRFGDEYPALQRLRVPLVIHLNNLGHKYREMGQFPQSRDTLRRLQAVCESLRSGGFRGVVGGQDVRLFHARCCYNLGLVERELRRREESLPLFLKARALFREVVGKPPSGDASAAEELGEVLQAIAEEQVDRGLQVGRGKEKHSRDEEIARERHFHDAVESLREAVQVGSARAANITGSAELAPLRGRKDFQEVVQQRLEQTPEPEPNRK